MRGISVLLIVVGVALARAKVEKCPAEQETDWSIELLLRHEDCNKFYKCTYGEPVEQTCFSGLYFNLETWQCDWPENVDCEDRKDPATKPTPEPTTPAPTTPETTTPEPTTPEPTTPEPTTPELTTKVPTIVETTTPEPTTPVPTIAETTTTEPTTPVPTITETTTPEPTTPEPSTPKPTAAPTETPTTTESTVEVWPTPEPETEPPTEVEIEFLPNGCPVDPHVHWLLPNEADCNWFYYCVWGELVPRICPAGLHFNPTIQVCDWPVNAGCNVSANKHAEARRHLLKQYSA